MSEFFQIVTEISEWYEPRLTGVVIGGLPLDFPKLLRASESLPDDAEWFRSATFPPGGVPREPNDLICVWIWLAARIHL